MIDQSNVRLGRMCDGTVGQIEGSKATSSIRTQSVPSHASARSVHPAIGSARADAFTWQLR